MENKQSARKIGGVSRKDEFLIKMEVEARMKKIKEA
jgi:hypothetical protein